MTTRCFLSEDLLLGAAAAATDALARSVPALSCQLAMRDNTDISSRFPISSSTIKVTEGTYQARALDALYADTAVTVCTGNDLEGTFEGYLTMVLLVNALRRAGW